LNRTHSQKKKLSTKSREGESEDPAIGSVFPRKEVRVYSKRDEPALWDRPVGFYEEAVSCEKQEGQPSREGRILWHGQ